jgi:hypothetical protein
MPIFVITGLGNDAVALARLIPIIPLAMVEIFFTILHFIGALLFGSSKPLRGSSIFSFSSVASVLTEGASGVPATERKEFYT